MWATSTAAVVFLASLIAYAAYCESHTQSELHLEYSKLYLEFFKVIVVSFFVALVGILLPALMRETQQAFERRKEARIALRAGNTR